MELGTVINVIIGVIFGLVSLLMLGAVLLQESKGGGLAALGGTRAESAFGASNPLRRFTAVLAVLFFLLAGTLSLRLAPEGSVTERIKKEKEGAVSTEKTVEDEGNTGAGAKDKKSMPLTVPANKDGKKSGPAGKAPEGKSAADKSTDK